MRLESVSSSHVATRNALHQIAFFAMAPARYAVTERMGLMAAPGGFGTPRFAGKIARVEGDTLVFETEEAVATQTITTVRTAAQFFGVDYHVDWFEDFHDPLEPADPDVTLVVDDASARAIGQWFNFGTEVLERLAAHGVEASEVQLWPEHFDPAIEMGSEQAGQRASFGASPGDASHPEPYLYVAPWGDVDSSDGFWNAEGFKGASLSHGDLRDADDPVSAGVDFLLEGYRAITS